MKSGPGGVYYVIDHVAPGSVASAKGLKVGDRVLSVQGQEAKHISGDQVTHYMMQRPLHMVTLTEDRLEFQPPSSPASSLAARPPADQSHVQPAVDDAATRYKEERDEAARSLETERSTRQAVEAELNEERTARHAVEGQLRELMSQAQSLQAVNGELRRALEALEAAQRHQANAATTARTMQTAVSAPLADKPASPAPTRAATTVSSATSAARKYHATSTRRHFSCPLWVWM
jgi:flagellar biosynthesis GTPase FlhF